MPEISWLGILSLNVLWTPTTALQILPSSHYKTTSAKYSSLIPCRKMGIFTEIQGDLNG